MPVAAVIERRTRAVELARSGWSYDEIAQQLGYASRSGAWHAVRKALDDHQAGEVEEFRALELQRLDSLQVALWPKALEGDVNAIQGILKIIDQRCRLLGLYVSPLNQGVERGDASLVDPAYWEGLGAERDRDPRPGSGTTQADS